MTPPVLPGQLGERKQNQRCWMCTERRTCTRVRVGAQDRWECDPCQAVT